MAQERQILSLVSPATQLGTRRTLSDIMDALSPLLPAEKAGVVEIALAEILNNIVEHAYADTAKGDFRVAAFAGAGCLRFDIADDGAPLPGFALPPGRDHDLTGPRDSLPEGGFGWMLIRSMARDLDYTHENGSNLLRITFDIALR